MTSLFNLSWFDTLIFKNDATNIIKQREKQTMGKKSKSSSIVKSEEVVEEAPAVLETVEEVPDEQESSNPRNSKKSHKKHKKSKKSHRHRSSKEELQKQDDLIEELEQ